MYNSNVHLPKEFCLLSELDIEYARRTYTNTSQIVSLVSLVSQQYIHTIS